MRIGDNYVILALVIGILFVQTTEIGTYSRAESRAGDTGEARLDYSTYLGGDDDDFAGSISHTPSGEIIICGQTKSGGFPTTTGAAFTEHAGLYDVFVCKFDQADEMVFSTFIGGDGQDIPKDIVVDAQGDIHITGSTSSDDWPVTVDAYQSTYSGGGDMFVCELSADGSELLHSTYLGGTGHDVGWGIELGVDGRSIIAGSTKSTDFPMIVPFTQHHGGETDVTVTSYSSDYSTMLSSRYIGGEDNDHLRELAIGQDGSIYVAGGTESSDIPWDDEYLPSGTTGRNAFLFTLDEDAHTIEHSLVIGGSDHDWANSVIPLDGGGCYFVGDSYSDDFPITEGGDPLSGSNDVTICQLDMSGRILYSTMIGGSDRDSCRDVVTDGKGNLYLTGFTDSLDFPTSDGAIQKEFQGGGLDTYCLVYNLSRREIDYSTYLGGSGNDYPVKILTDNLGFVTLFGESNSGDFPVTVDALQSELNGTYFDAYISRINTDTIPPEIEHIQDIHSYPRGGILYLHVNVSDNVGDTELFINYRYGNGDAVDSLFNGSGHLEIPRQPEGDLTYSFSAVDTAGNWVTTGEYTITLVNVPPTISDLPVWDVQEGTYAVLPLASYIDDVNGDPITITCSDPNITVDQGSMVLQLHHDEYVPDRLVTVTVFDGEATATTSLTIKVNNVNDLPVITYLLPPDGVEYRKGDKIAFIVDVTDEDGDTLTITWKDGEEVMGTGSPLEYDKLGKGEHTITVVVDDGSGTVEDSFTVVVKEEEDVPGLGLFLAVAAVMVAGLVKRRRR